MAGATTHPRGTAPALSARRGLLRGTPAAAPGVLAGDRPGTAGAVQDHPVGDPRRTLCVRTLGDPAEGIYSTYFVLKTRRHFGGGTVAI